MTRKQQRTDKLVFNFLSNSFLERSNHASYLLSRAIHLASACKLMCVHVHEMINTTNKSDSSYGEEVSMGNNSTLSSMQKRNLRPMDKSVYVCAQYGKLWSIQKRRLIQTHRKTDTCFFKIDFSTVQSRMVVTIVQ